MWDDLVQALRTMVDVDSDSDRHGAAKAKYDILFHCHGGVNRSTTAICVFLRQYLDSGNSMHYLSEEISQHVAQTGLMLEALLDFEPNKP